MNTLEKCVKILISNLLTMKLFNFLKIELELIKIIKYFMFMI